ncbi:uncharacterized protein LOC100328993 [Saccoglossus kowalevskii]|uniref:SKI family transcriptional corepressor 1 homolog-B n=2 Tax=Saccoglossus kowalevskii TaxID=10224 RepID=A0ABM0H1N2_SACKO|nr:PREDICTED: SKI family transcriptional corepressor 1 homolog-B [Saccoglossus kowalevskii]
MALSPESSTGSAHADSGIMVTIATTSPRHSPYSHSRESDDSAKEDDHPDPACDASANPNPNICRTVILNGVPIASLVIDRAERLCLAQISNTLLKGYSYNEIHNRRVALGITCVQCTPVQLEILRRAGAMPISSRRCGMITKREAERLCKSFLEETTPPKLPENFAFDVEHFCAWGCRGSFIPSRYNSSRAKCIKCAYCNMYFSPNKFIFHSHRTPTSKYNHPDAANFNSWRRHIQLTGKHSDELMHAWEDVKAMFNGGSRKRALSGPQHHHHHQSHASSSSSSITSFDFGLNSSQPEKRTRLDYDQQTMRNNAISRPFSYPLIPVPNKSYAMQGDTIMPKKSDMAAATSPSSYPAMDLIAKKHLSPTSLKRGFSDMMWGGTKEVYPMNNPWTKTFGMGIGSYYPAPITNGGMPSYKGQTYPMHQATERNKLLSPQLASPLSDDVDLNRREDDEKFNPWDLEMRKKHAEKGDKVGDSGESSNRKVTKEQQDAQYVSAFRPVNRNHSSDKLLVQSKELALQDGNDQSPNYNTVRDNDENIRPDLSDDNLSDDDDVEDEEDNHGHNNSSDIDIVDDVYKMSTPIEISLHKTNNNNINNNDNNRPGEAETNENDDEATQHHGEEMEHLIMNENEKKSPNSVKCPTEVAPVSLSITKLRHSPVIGQVSRPFCDVTSHCSSTGPLSGVRVKTPLGRSGSTPKQESEAGDGLQQTHVHTAVIPPTDLVSNQDRDSPSPDCLNHSSEIDRHIDIRSFQSKCSSEKDMTSMDKGELENALRRQIQLRKKFEQECQHLKDTFQNQVKRELAYREEMAHQLQRVRDTLCHELDQERKARLAIQQKLKGDEMALAQHLRKSSQSVTDRSDIDRTFAYWRLAMFGAPCLPTQHWRAMVPMRMNGDASTDHPSELNLSSSENRISTARTMELYGNTRRTSTI